ncbi:hypothetical protein [Bradyrhizobium sp. 1]|uniref:hypothetical protein n=1 Tax=Bradyrhizobium sp. 1 TaxID=241591 RepID=UPI001FFA6E1C|nr:hypothetical protein [Bradyrhizobium sp. 1]MCK1392660.1 hypothetical protein [Bradyrhizobium sp. 1]
MAAAVVGWVGWGSTARADWASCQSKPTRSCLLDEALRSGDGQLTGKERLDVMVLTGYRNHPEYLAPADIEEAKQQVMDRQASSPALPWQYFSLATTGLVAADRIQEAYDLMSELDARWVNSALDEVIRALIKAGKPDEIPVFGRPVLADPRHVFNTAVKTLADQGNIEQALVLTALHPTGLPDEDTLTWLGVAYAKRGDGKTAARFYARAQANIEGKKVYSVTDDTAIELRFKQIVLQAVRGDIDGVRTALKELPAVSGRSDRAEMNRNVGYQQLVGFLLSLENPAVALEIAKSGPEPYRTLSLMTVALWDGEHGRSDETRAILPLLGDNVDPKIRGTLQRALAIAAAKSGDIKSAAALASETNDSVRRRAIMFELAQSLPP